jgi:Ca-activated chloride channel family protein
MTGPRSIETLITTAILAALAAAVAAGCAGDDAGLGGAYPDTGADTDADSDADDDPLEPDTDDTECDTVNESVFYISADDSNSMAGPAVARFLINNGQRVTGAIRTYEFLNYYTFDYDSPAAGSVRTSAQLRVAADEESYDLQIGVRAADLDDGDRRPLNITLSIDTSGSMGGTPIQRVKQCCVALASSLRAGDVVSMVTWNTTQSTVLQSHAVQSANDATLIGECNSLTAGGSTDLHSGLVRAYELAALNFEPSRINRVVLISDGGANAGVTDEELIAEHADDAEGEAIYLMGVGVGDDDTPNYYNDQLMDAVTDAGKGAYIFVDSAQEAAEMFGERLLGNIDIAARDVRVELTLPPTFEMIEFHGEEYSDNPDEVEPQHLAPGDAMIFHQTVGSCDPAVPTLDDEVRVLVSWDEPIARAAESDELVTTLGDLLEADNSLLLKGNAVVAYAGALKQLRTLEGQAAKDLITATRAQVQLAAEALADDPDLAEIDQLLETYSLLY